MLVSYRKNPNKLEWAIIKSADKLDSVNGDWFTVVSTDTLHFSKNRKGSFVNQLSQSIDIERYLEDLRISEGNLHGKKLVIHPNTINKMVLNESLVKYWTDQVEIRERLGDNSDDPFSDLVGNKEIFEFNIHEGT